MLRYVTNKLKTQSITEDGTDEKTRDENHDSGTESDEDVELAELPIDPPPSKFSPATSSDLQDAAHSSEEELEVINSNKGDRTSRPLRAVSVCLPEKRKWSEVGAVGTQRIFTPVENLENMSQFGNLTPYDSPYRRYCRGDESGHSGSSDDEVHNLLSSMSTPVQFRTSPPIEAVKPGGRKTPLNKIRSLSPPAKFVHYELSPRKRSRHARHVKRPYLDFEKMQQVKARSVTAWRHNGDHGGELSVFCW